MEKANDKARRKVEQEIGKLLFDLVKLTYAGLFISALAAFLLQKKLTPWDLVLAIVIAALIVILLFSVGVFFVRRGHQKVEDDSND